ncbi:MAG TPA: hypothetical protein VHD87_15535 [Acidimicrobiales bacterium]|nr:hypothetical protein [Acidimicrobiales bacterium]
MSVIVTVELDSGGADAAAACAEFTASALSPYHAAVEPTAQGLAITFDTNLSLDVAFNAVHHTLGIALDAGLVTGARHVTATAYSARRTSN